MQTISQNFDGFASIMGNRSQPLGSASNDGPSNSNTSRDSPTPWLAGRLTSGWADLEALYNIAGGEGTLGDGLRNSEPGRNRRAIPVINDVWHDDIPGFRRAWAYSRSGSREHQQHPDDTAGLSWSEDGQTL